MPTINHLESYSYITGDNITIINKNTSSNHIEFTFIDSNKNITLAYINSFDDIINQNGPTININNNFNKLRIQKDSYTYENQNTLFNIRLNENKIEFFNLIIHNPFEKFQIRISYNQNILSIQIKEFDDKNIPQNYTTQYIIYYEKNFAEKVSEKILEFCKKHNKTISNKNSIELSYYIEEINKILENIKEIFSNCPNIRDKELLNKIIEQIKIKSEPNIVKKLKLS